MPMKQKLIFAKCCKIERRKNYKIYTATCRVNYTGKINAVYAQHKQRRKETGRLIRSFLRGKHED